MANPVHRSLLVILAAWSAFLSCPLASYAAVLDSSGDGFAGVRKDILQKVTVPIVSNDECNGWYAQSGKLVHLQDTQLCAGFKEGKKDACQGDSGGPLMFYDGSKYVLIGVISAGFGCARPLLPGLYTRVSEYKPWLNKYINS
ncbi:hypothetical protein HPB49_011108 [Dermacentor silvarum]|uniref:Uncharacterized protein n=1 Tax=Dermacentor silvarum TaxID=543639 RepID=A0ACB8CKR4_DERSI|nr:hypothetical protein HPB49_011108 [Dermacentor silvarum]